MSDSDSCPAPPESAYITPVNVVGSLTFQELIQIISAVLLAITFFLWLGLLIPHLRSYHVPNEQRLILRILPTPLIFSAFSVISIFSYDAYHYTSPLISLYEGYSMASIFLLFVLYVAPDPATRNEVFRGMQVKTRKGKVRPGKNRLSWFKLRWRYVFIFIFLLTILTFIELVTVITEIYCRTSNSARFVSIWLQVSTLLVTILALFALFTFYSLGYSMMLSHQPRAKFFIFKILVAVNVLQHFIFGILEGNLEGDENVTYYDLTVGLPNFLLVIESAIFMGLYYICFTAKEYQAPREEAEPLVAENKPRKPAYTPGRAIMHAMNPADLLWGILVAFRWSLGFRY